MSKKTLNTANLAALGAERLAELLIEVSTGSADMKRRLRLELSHNLGPAELARDVRKRLVTIRRAKSYVGWRKRPALIKDLRTQSAMIIDKIAPDAPADAFDLLFDFRADVIGFDLGSESLGAGGSLESGDSGADDEHLGRL